MSDIINFFSALFVPSTANSIDFVSFDNCQYRMEAKSPMSDNSSTHLFFS